MSIDSDQFLFDLSVVGEAVIDIFDEFSPPIRRPGGLYYSALTANAFSKRVSIFGCVGEEKNEFIGDLQKKGIEINQSFFDSNLCIAYHLRNVDEILPQVLVTKSPTKKIRNTIPDNLIKTNALLLYPIDDKKLLVKIAENVKQNGGVVFFDLQHDINDLASLKRLIKLADYIFASRQELLQITQTQNDSDAILKLRGLGAKTIIIKYGMGGSTIYTYDGQILKIPSFLSNFKCSIGAGDVYNSVFAISKVSGLTDELSGKRAALVASVFCEHLNYDDVFKSIQGIDFDKEERQRTKIYAHPEDLSKIQIYLAGHFFSSPMRIWINLIEEILESRGFSVFCPYKDVGILNSHSGNQEKINCFNKDLDGLKNSQIMVALLDNIGLGGTCWEMGFAFTNKIPIFGIMTDKQHPISNMIINSCKSINASIPNFLNDLYEFLPELLSEN